MKSQKCRDIVFVADAFRDRMLGGAECNDSVLIEHLENLGHKVRKIRSQELRVFELVSNGSFFIIGNFIGMSEEVKDAFVEGRIEYIIYEHDHKYLKTRDPSRFKNFKAPQDQIINADFYRNAKAVVVLSEVCREVIRKNLSIDNVYNIGCSLWTEERLDFLEILADTEKTKNAAVLNSKNPTKGTQASYKYCIKNDIDYYLIASSREDIFLKTLAPAKKLVYIPQVLETFCRLAAEAKMLNCKLITKPKMLGFSSEDCFQLSGKELIDDMRARVRKALGLFDVLISNKQLPKEIKKVAFIGKFRKLYDEEGKAHSLEREGVEVRRFDEMTFNRIAPNNLQTLLDYKPDVVFFTKLRVPRAQEVLDECKKHKIKTACWMPDLYFGLPREQEVINKTPMFRADYVFSPDGGSQKKFEECGVNHHLIRQAIYDESCEIYDDELRNVEKKYDVLFVGTLGHEHGAPRARLLAFLEKEYGTRFHWAGSTGPNEIRDSSLTELILQSKIVIGDCVLSKKYWSNRIYETLGRGGFLIHPAVPGLEEEFEDGKHLVTFEYDNLHGDLKQKIVHYLLDEKGRERIRKQGMEYVEKNHTLMNRTRQVLEVLRRG